MITASDLLIVVGVSVALAGCWLHTLQTGLIGTGLAICFAARVLHGLQRKERRR